MLYKEHMIIKFLSRKSNTQGQLVRYVCRYILRDNKPSFDENAVLILRHNIRTRNINGYIHEFKIGYHYADSK